MFRPDVMLRSSFPQSYEPTIYAPTALSIASKEAANVSLNERFQASRKHELSKSSDEHPTHYFSPRERSIFLCAVCCDEIRTLDSQYISYDPDG